MKTSFLPKIFFLAAAISWGQCVFAGPDANPGMWIARDQDSTTADFLEPSKTPLHFQNGQIPSDPLAEKNGLNLYGFVNNDPINSVDAFGLITIAIPGVGPQTDQGGNSSNEDFIRGVKKRESDTQVFSRDNLDEAVKAIKKALKCGDKTVKIYGYSRGGVGAIELARKLRDEGIDVNLLFTLDPVKVPFDITLAVPSNAKTAVNHWHKNVPKLGPFDFPSSPVSGAQNAFHPSGKENGITVSHETMPVIVLP